MITPEGYSKDPSLRPDGIVITWSQDMIDLKGGLLAFTRFFFAAMDDPESTWLQKCKNRPKYDGLLYVYIIYAGRVRYRLNYVMHAAGETIINEPGAPESFSRSVRVWWPRVVMCGPIMKAPHVIKLRGFQGFRYCTKLF